MDVASEHLQRSPEHALVLVGLAHSGGHVVGEASKSIIKVICGWLLVLVPALARGSQLCCNRPGVAREHGHCVCVDLFGNLCWGRHLQPTSTYYLQ